MLRRVALVRISVSEKRITSIIRVTRSSQLGTLAVNSNRNVLRRNTNIYYSLTIVFFHTELLLLVTANFVPSSPIFSTLMMKVIRSPETSFLTIATRRHIAEDPIFVTNFVHKAFQRIRVPAWGGTLSKRRLTLNFMKKYYPMNLWDVTGTNKSNSVALSPQVNYTDWATATCRRNLVLTFADREVSRGQCGGSPRSLISAS
jgi:hypothetical protein